jgi:hypothetical protein
MQNLKNIPIIKSNFFLKPVFFLLIILLGFSSCKNDSIVLVKNGSSKYVIVLESEASEGVVFAANEFQGYIEKISEVKIPIANPEVENNSKHKIFLKATSIDTDQIEIGIKGDDLFIVGGSDAAVKNAVYELLETHLGCKWLSPTEERIPALKKIELARTLNVSYTPDITTRTVHSRLFYDNHEFAGKHKVTTESFPYYVPGARVHTFHRFVPEEVYFKDHPEYFALRGDKRLPTQLCLTNPEVYAIVKDSVRSFFNRHPESSVISVSQNDNQQYCQDEKCKEIDDSEGSPAGTMIQFVNKIAANFPDKTISTLAYQYTRKPCKTEPLDNVLITLCSIECDRSASIEEKCVDFADDLRGWNKITSNIRIWDYTTQFTNYLAPFPNIHTLGPNIRFFRDNHAKWVFEQHSSQPSELFKLRSYLTAKLLWNPDLDSQEIITEFTEGYYEEAGVYVRNYVDLIHKKIEEDPKFFLFLYGDPSQAFTSYLNPELLKTYIDLFDEAEKVVAHKPAMVDRVKEARISIDFAELEACRKNLTDDFQLVITGQDGSKEVNQKVIDKLESFMRTCKKNDITQMNEMRFTVQEYYENYKNALQVAVKPNKAVGKNVTLLTKPKKYAKEDPQTLTDGALGGNSFYANWLGFEGNDMEAVIDLETSTSVSSISTAFLQVTNHVVFFPNSVSYYYSTDNKNFKKLGTVLNDEPLLKTSKINDIKYFNLDFSEVKARYIKIKGSSMKEPPYWHHAAGNPSWIFADEVLIN